MATFNVFRLKFGLNSGNFVPNRNSLSSSSLNLLILTNTESHANSQAKSFHSYKKGTNSGLLSVIFFNKQTVRHGHKKNFNFKPFEIKPQYIEKFEYSGDLRPLPKVDEMKPLYEYKDLSHIIGNNTFLQKLSSIEFATEDAKYENKVTLIKDRIQELFGPDCELEQEIALLTLEIRTAIPKSIERRLNKKKSRWVKNIIDERKEALTKLRELDHERFEWLLRELKIQYVIPRDKEPERTEFEIEKLNKNQEVIAEQRKKLESLKAQFNEEKTNFYNRKAQIMQAIDKDLEAYGLEREFLEDIVKREKEVIKEKWKDTMTWEERAKIGMIDVKHVFPPKPVDPRLIRKYEKLEREKKREKNKR